MKQKDKITRAGQTETYSVSVSREFDKLIQEYSLSPTEIFRKGMAVSLCELNISKYQSETNRKRLEFVNKFMALYASDVKALNFFEELSSFSLMLKEFLK